MGVEARSVRPAGGAPKRKLRNYLLDKRFQLKYTGMVVGVTLVVASILGALAYRESQGQTEAMQVQLAMQPDLDPQAVASLEAFGKERDRQILAGIVGGIAALVIALAMTGIVVTHKMVGPAYKIRLLLARVAAGHLRVDGGLRKGDELQDVFNAFNDMVNTLRSRQASEIALLDEALVKAEQAGTPSRGARHVSPDPRAHADRARLSPAVASRGERARSERRFVVVEARRIAVEHDRRCVEANLVCALGMLGQPLSRRSPNAGDLGSVDRLDRVQERALPARAHLAKHEEIAPPCDEVDLQPAHAGVARHDLEALQLQVTRDEASPSSPLARLRATWLRFTARRVLGLHAVAAADAVAAERQHWRRTRSHPGTRRTRRWWRDRRSDRCRRSTRRSPVPSRSRGLRDLRPRSHSFVGSAGVLPCVLLSRRCTMHRRLRHCTELDSM